MEKTKMINKNRLNNYHPIGQQTVSESDLKTVVSAPTGGNKEWLVMVSNENKQIIHRLTIYAKEIESAEMDDTLIVDGQIIQFCSGVSVDYTLAL